MTTQNDGFRARVDRFFFAMEVPYAMALLRMVFPIALMGMVLPRWYVVRELFSTDGATAQLSSGYGYTLLPEVSGTVAVALYAVM
ncbi:MAG TPA: hypothetical protein VGM98_01655, partial [Schlesneria sp.]